MAPIPRYCPGDFVDVGFGPLEGRLARCLALLALSLGAGGPSAGWVAVGTGFGTGPPRWSGVAPLRGEVLWILGDQGSQLLESYWCYCGRDVDYFACSMGSVLGVLGLACPGARDLHDARRVEDGIVYAAQFAREFVTQRVDDVAYEGIGGHVVLQAAGVVRVGVAGDGNAGQGVEVGVAVAGVHLDRP